MSSAQISVRPYNGSLIGDDFRGTNTFLVSHMSSAQTGVFIDGDGTLGPGDTTSTFNGQTITFLASGTVRPGIPSLPLGASKPVLVFQAGTKIYFYFPEGEPNLLASVTMTIRGTDTPYEVIPPVCYAGGTRLMTDRGARAVETLRAGDRVIDDRGRAHAIRWVLRREIEMGNLPAHRTRSLVPVRIRRGALGPGLPARDLLVSQQHLVLIEHAAAALLFGTDRVLVPARALIGHGAELRPVARVSYHQVLLDRHAVLLAEGLPAESLRMGPAARDLLTEAQAAELAGIAPDLAGPEAALPAAESVLSMREGRLLLSAMAAMAPRRGGAAGESGKKIGMKIAA